MTERVRREGGYERRGRNERSLLHEKGGELPQEVGILTAGECDIVGKAALRGRRW